MKTAKTVIEYVLAMVKARRYVELIVRLETALDTLNKFEEEGHIYYGEDIINAVCRVTERETEDGNASYL